LGARGRRAGAGRLAGLTPGLSKTEPVCDACRLFACVKALQVLLQRIEDTAGPCRRWVSVHDYFADASAPSGTAIPRASATPPP
jgi:hypothetical protein